MNGFSKDLGTGDLATLWWNIVRLSIFDTVSSELSIWWWWGLCKMQKEKPVDRRLLISLRK